jgi:hypothetical protein
MTTKGDLIHILKVKDYRLSMKLNPDPREFCIKFFGIFLKGIDPPIINFIFGADELTVLIDAQPHLPVPAIDHCESGRGVYSPDVSAAPAIWRFMEMADNQPEVLARHCTEAGLIEKAVGLWGKAGQRSLARLRYSKIITAS